ncbi:TolC family protein [Aporhodopirellula aestuarii]|uniref:TolC family protein n=1 Tax=Aporhodopirellula aestuarii TaxID=2950107 RepID=A0ABT0TZI2_9BACT|nr:TolC family protein [Aporhodopirellula aestuarii]MCM2369972.1 TolC family protein [Aporhodopirellula aestuarii]
MNWLSRTSEFEKAKCLILVTLVATSAGGCATQHGAQITSNTVKTSPTATTAPDPAAPNDVDWQQILDHPESPQIKRTDYTDEALVDSPPILATANDEESTQSFGDFLQLAAPTPESEIGTQIDGEINEESGDPEAASWEHQAGTDAKSNGNDDVHSNAVLTKVSQPPTPDSQLTSFINIAITRHPKILAAQHRVAAASNVIPQAKALPDPTLNNTFWPFQDQALQTAAGRIGHQMSISQPVPFPQKLKTKATIASREVQIAQAEVDAITREITESVRLAYYEVWFATRAIQIIEETKALVVDLTDVAEARYRSGGTQQDVLRAQLETDRLDEQLITLRRQKQVAQADLATLLQQPVDLLPETSDDLGITDTAVQIESLIAMAEQCNPKLRGLAWEIQRDRDKQRLACLQKYPDFSVGVHWGLVSDDYKAISPVANGHDNVSISFGTTLPIWRDKINAGIREAAHRTSSTTRRLEAERDELYGKIRRLIAQADALNEQRDIYENRIIPRTETTLKLTIADYRGKRADFFTLIETYRELLMFETQLARIDATLAGTIAQLDRTVGCAY